MSFVGHRITIYVDPDGTVTFSDVPEDLLELVDLIGDRQI